MADPIIDRTSAMRAITKQKSEAIKLAREQGAAVVEMCRRAKADPPPYTFEELIGKGAYGRVYKGHHIPSQNVVAIKVLEVDTPDYQALRDFKDESIKDFIHESKVMQQVKDAKAKNINMIIEAVSIHSQLWLVCEYCPGGSVKTLMRATGDKLPEKFIIPIARELAEGLRAIHEAGIIHRDVKAGNVLVHEEGRLQICDFGVAGVLQSNIDKRTTWIGTPHWMPPEMFSNKTGDAHAYGSEIDVWAYGCTLFECATGLPPNANLRQRMQIGRQLGRKPPKLEGDSYSEELRSLVSYALNTDPSTRPTMKDILEHPYIANSEEKYPTSSLSELVKIYYQWTQGGGQRMSLFNPGGAMAAEIPGPGSFDDEDWNFSTTDNFERRFSLIDFDQISATLADIEKSLSSFDQKQVLPPLRDPFEEVAQNMPLTAAEQANFDERVKRGAVAMEGLFDENKPGYKYETKKDFVPIEERQSAYTDLTSRMENDRTSVASTNLELNLGAFDANHYASPVTLAPPPFDPADADTLKASQVGQVTSQPPDMGASYVDEEEDTYQYGQPSGPRPPTMEWKFPSAIPEVNEEPPAQPEPEADKGPRPPTMEWTFPSMETGGQDEKASAPSSRPPTAMRHSANASNGSATARPRASEATKDRPPTMEWTFPSMTEEPDMQATVKEARPPTLEWSFPQITSNASDADGEDGNESGPGEIVIESRSASPDERKDDGAGNWSMPVVSMEDSDREDNRETTWKHRSRAPSHYSYASRQASMSRPSTAASSDGDPFRLDGPASPLVRLDASSATPQDADQGAVEPAATSPMIGEPAPTPIIEEEPSWQHEQDDAALTVRQAHRTVPMTNPPAHAHHALAPLSSHSLGAPPSSPAPAPFPPALAAKQSAPSIATTSTSAGTGTSASINTATSSSRPATSRSLAAGSSFSSFQPTSAPTPSPAGPVPFPPLMPPSLACLDGDAPDEALAAELERLMAQFMQGLSATRCALVQGGPFVETEQRV